jgi:beta-lactam-binding protein with PASTA domain
MRLRSLGVVLLATVGIFVFGALIMNFVVMPLFVHQRNSVIVPDVRAVAKQQAQKSVERVSLQFRVDRTQYHPDVPGGHIISQRPRANDTVKEGRTVSVVVSLGPKTQRVPELKNMTLRQGRLVLSRQKLAAGRIARVLRESDARETVLACAPSVGREVEEGTEIDLLVGVGGRPKRYMMPDLEGQDLLFIRDKLESSGFRVSNVRYEPRRDVYPNTIVDQSPRPGVMIREGDSIELVAAGSE